MLSLTSEKGGSMPENCTLLPLVPFEVLLLFKSLILSFLNGEKLWKISSTTFDP